MTWRAASRPATAPHGSPPLLMASQQSPTSPVSHASGGLPPALKCSLAPFEDQLGKLCAEHRRQLEKLMQEVLGKLVTEFPKHKEQMTQENATLRGAADAGTKREDSRHSQSQASVAKLATDASDTGAQPLPSISRYASSNTQMSALQAVSRMETNSQAGSGAALIRGLTVGSFSAHSDEVIEFTLKPEWDRKAKHLAGVGDLSQAVLPSHTQPLVLAEEAPLAGSGLPRCIINPSDWRKLLWDICGFFFVAYDFIFIPLQVFDLNIYEFHSIMNILSLIFWTVDVVLSFNTGYYTKGELVLQHRAAAIQYIRTWFIVDIVVVVPDWIMLFVGNTFFSRLGRLFRAARTLRILRLLRLAKLGRLITSLYDLLGSEFSFLVASLARLLLLILFLNHLLACTWYMIGEMEKKSGRENWIQDAGQPPVDGASFWYKYTTSLHWSMTQFTPAGMDVSARNVPERIFSVAVLFFAMVTFSSVIASVTTAMSALRSITGGDTKQFWLLRRYLRQEAVGHALMVRILRYAEYQCRLKESRIQAGSINLLGDLSYQLHTELASELYGRHLADHNFFRYVKVTMCPIMHRLSHHALKLVPYASDDEVFEAEEESSRMLFVKSGQFRYQLIDTVDFLLVTTKMWCSEATLWTDWQHRGRLFAASPGALVELHPKCFMEAMFLHPRSWRFAQSYGQRFLRFLNGLQKEALTDMLYSKELVDKSIDEDHAYIIRRGSRGFSAELSPVSSRPPEGDSFRKAVGNGHTGDGGDSFRKVAANGHANDGGTMPGLPGSLSTPRLR